jgi:hypothetical protein
MADVKESDFVLAERESHDTDLSSCDHLDIGRDRVRFDVFQKMGMVVARMDHNRRS